MGKKSPDKLCWDNWISMCKRMQLSKIIKLLEGNISAYLCDPGSSNGFLNMKSKAQSTKEKVNK